MTQRFGRRKFLVYGTAAAGTSLLLKACGSSPDTASDAVPAEGDSAAAPSGDTIKVGILHSLSGTMAISETTVVDAERMA
ncbi:MAG: transporter substrate-binding protein, partial [Leptolyngbya sp. SIO4C1]|nr:transporter substrate-binding protein [Leptolyngbya sp. SIO4C1]